MNGHPDNLRVMLGQSVRVTVDRPMGYQHGSITYPINYGYIPGTIAPDGEELDAYILGVSEPLSSFYGRVIGIIRRKNDCEDKLVVAPENMLFHQGQIAEATAFQEQYFVSTVESLLRKSCGVIPYRRNEENIEFLLLFQCASQSWSFPKGHMEAGETEEETALRELQEETGLKAVLIPEARIAIEYSICPQTKKQVVLFLGEVQGDIVLQTQEVRCSQWVDRTQLKTYLHPDSLAAANSLIQTYLPR